MIPGFSARVAAIRADPTLMLDPTLIVVGDVEARAAARRAEWTRNVERLNAPEAVTG